MNILSLFRALKRNWQIVCFAAFVLIVITSIGVFFFVQGRSLMEQELRERLRTIASISALQFRAEDLDQFHSLADMNKPTYSTVIRQLQAIRSQNPDILFMYILRPRSGDAYEFIADADSLFPVAMVDLNKDGVLDDSDQPAPPGTPYDVSNFPSINSALFGATTSDEPYTDQWGTFMSGFAPILDRNGKAVAILGVDIDAQNYVSLSHRVLSPTIVLLILMAAMMLSGLIGAYLWRRRIESLKRLDRERTGLLLLAMHQIGSPLAIIRWSLEALLDNTAKDSLQEAIDLHAKQTGAAITQLDGILNELEDASEVDAGTLAYNREEISLHEVVSSVVSGLSEQLRQRGHSIDLHSDPTLRLSVDRKLIAGVLRELIINAMTYSPDKSGITVTAKRGGKCVLVEVSDHGCGISKSDLGRIFEKFTRGTGAHLYQPNGNGLGLYIVKGIIQKAGGNIWVKSKEKQGTTVTFTLPC